MLSRLVWSAVSRVTFKAKGSERVLWARPFSYFSASLLIKFFLCPGKKRDNFINALFARQKINTKIPRVTLYIFRLLISWRQINRKLVVSIFTEKKSVPFSCHQALFGPLSSSSKIFCLKMTVLSVRGPNRGFSASLDIFFSARFFRRIERGGECLTLQRGQSVEQQRFLKGPVNGQSCPYSFWHLNELSSSANMPWF